MYTRVRISLTDFLIRRSTLSPSSWTSFAALGGIKVKGVNQEDKSSGRGVLYNILMCVASGISNKYIDELWRAAIYLDSSPRLIGILQVFRLFLRQKVQTMPDQWRDELFLEEGIFSMFAGQVSDDRTQRFPSAPRQHGFRRVRDGLGRRSKRNWVWDWDWSAVLYEEAN